MAHTNSPRRVELPLELGGEQAVVLPTLVRDELVRGGPERRVIRSSVASEQAAELITASHAHLRSGPGTAAAPSLRRGPTFASDRRDCSRCPGCGSQIGSTGTPPLQRRQRSRRHRPGRAHRGTAGDRLACPRLLQSGRGEAPPKSWPTAHGSATGWGERGVNVPSIGPRTTVSMPV